MRDEGDFPRMRQGDARVTLQGLLFQGNAPDLTIDQAIEKYGEKLVQKAILGTLENERHNARKLFHFPPTVFVSYRRATTEIESWAQRFVQYLRGRGYAANLDLDNPIQGHDSIPSFVANLPHSDIVIVLNTEDYGRGKLRPWIKAERHSALLNALEGACDILIFRCDPSPLADDWMEAFPVVDIALNRTDLSFLDEIFPVVPKVDKERQTQIDDLLPRIKLNLDPEAAAEVIAELDRCPELMTLTRAQEVRAVLKSKSGLDDVDRPWFDSFIYRNSGRRLRFAHVMAAKGKLPLAITSLRPFLRGEDRNGSAGHHLIGELLEEQGQYNGARNHFRVAYLQAVLAGTETECRHLLGEAACSMKLFEGQAAIGALNKARASRDFRIQNTSLMNRIIAAVTFEQFAAAIWCLDHDLRRLERGLDVHQFTEHKTPVVCVQCDSCRSEVDASFFLCHVCACCSCSYPDPEVPAREDSVDPEASFLHCPICSHTGEIGWTALFDGKFEHACPLCGIGMLKAFRVDPSDSFRARFAITTNDQFFQRFDTQAQDQARGAALQTIIAATTSCGAADLFLAISLHDGVVDGDDVERIAGQVDSRLTRDVIDDLFTKLTAEKLVCDLGKSQYVLHPVLAESAQTLWEIAAAPTKARWERAFLDAMTEWALDVVTWEIGQQIYFYSCHGPNLESALRLATGLGLPLHAIVILSAMAAYASKSHDFETARQRLEQVYALTEDERLRAITANKLGTNARERGDLAEAEKWFREALATCERLGEVEEAVTQYHDLGVVSFVKKDIVTAKDHFRDAITKSERLGSAEKIARAAAMLGQISLEEDDLDGAEHNFVRALDYFKSSPHRHNAAMVYESLGKLAERRGSLLSAREYFNGALAVSTSIKDTAGIGRALELIADLEIACKSVADGLRQYSLALECYTSLVDASRASVVCAKMGMVYWLIGHNHCAGAVWLIKDIRGRLMTGQDVTFEVQRLKDLYGQTDDADRKVIRTMWLPILDDHPQLGSISRELSAATEPIPIQPAAVVTEE